MEIGNTGKYPLSYLQDIVNNRLELDDAKDRGGNGDGEIDVNEAYNGFVHEGLFRHLEKGSETYNLMTELTTNFKGVVEKYAGDDGIFSASEYAELLNGDEWHDILSVYHSTEDDFYAQGEEKFEGIELSDEDKKAYQMEMSFLDENHIFDGKLTIGEVKVELLNSLSDKGIKVDTTQIENLIDMYAGQDGTFTTEEYAALKQDETYKAFIEQTGVQMDKRTDEQKAIQEEMYDINKKFDNDTYGNDNLLTKGEVKVNLLNEFRNKGINTKYIEMIIDRYAGRDGTFTTAEYTKLKNSSIYKYYMNKLQ